MRNLALFRVARLARIAVLEASRVVDSRLSAAAGVAAGAAQPRVASRVPVSVTKAHSCGAVSLLLTACAANPPASDARTLESSASWTSPHQEHVEPLNWPPFAPEPKWPAGALLLQGFFGVTSFSEVQTTDGSTSVDGDEGDLDQLPMLGGGGQWKIGGEHVDFGIEGMFNFAGRANATAFASGSNGAVLVVEADILLTEVYAGPFVNLFLGDKWRVYAAAGPLWQWANYDQDDGTTHDTGTGYGFGTYARTGIEVMLPSHMWVGCGVRWSRSEVDLGDTFGQLDVEGFQFLITASAGI